MGGSGQIWFIFFWANKIITHLDSNSEWVGLKLSYKVKILDVSTSPVNLTQFFFLTNKIATQSNLISGWVKFKLSVLLLIVLFRNIFAPKYAYKYF